MHVLATRDIEEWSGPIDVGTWTTQGVGKWAWSSDVLGGLLALAQARFEYHMIRIGRKKLIICVYCIRSPSHLTPVSLNTVYPSLSCSLLSHSHSLRLNTLRFLDSKKLIDKNHQNPDANGVVEVLKRCLQGEVVSLDLQGVRERVLRIGKVVQVVGDVRGAEVCARWLIG
jgi:U3 small nucleolar RNA-associated protein 20